MCLAVYIASSIELSTSAWEKGAPGFYVEKVPPGDKVRRQFSLPHVYYAGSHEGCGCGFLKEGHFEDELKVRQANYGPLAQCIRIAQARGARIELFSCWEGQQAVKPALSESRTVDDVETPAFQLQEGHFVNVI